MNKNELEALIKQNDELYWSGNAVIEDYEYDELVNQLREIDPTNPLVNKVNEAVVNSAKKVYHEKPMLSLDKVYSIDELEKWVSKVSRNENEMFNIQPKYDGISGLLENGVLSTRGNGYVGEDISDKLPIVKIDGNVKSNYILGELLIKKDDFSNITSPVTKKNYKNPRNAVAGIVGTDDIEYFVKTNAKLTLVPYDLNNFVVSKNKFKNSFVEIMEKIQMMPYPMDGIVIKLADNEYGDSLGATAHHPRNAVAFKFTNPQKETKVIDIEWSFGKNCLTPVAILEPVEINGVTIERVSLANYENVSKLNLYINDNVVIERAGDVIPHIVKVMHKEENTTSPFISHCPCCNSELVVKLPEICCPNDDCNEKIVRKLLFSIRSVGIEKVGIPTIQKIVESLKVKTLYDFMQLTVDDFKSIGFGDKTSENIFDEIFKHRVIEAYQFLTSLNIQDFGNEVAKLILDKYSFNDFFTLNEEQLISIKGIGSITANKILDYIKNNQEYIEKLKSCFAIVTTVKSKTDNDKTVCFTGAMENPRKYYENIAKEKGITPVSTVSSNLTYLVVADVNSNSSKMQKAKKYGTKILTVEEFINI